MAASGPGGLPVASRHDEAAHFHGPGSLKRQKAKEEPDAEKTSAAKSEPVHGWFPSASSAVASSSWRPQLVLEKWETDCKHEEAEPAKSEDWEEVKWEESEVPGEEGPLDDAQQQASGEPPVRRPVEDTLENVIDGIKTGRLAALAQTMQDDIGFQDSAWEKMPPRNALQAFLGRYTHAKNPEYFFEYITNGNDKYLARVVTPAFFGRHYGGYVPVEKRLAETDACSVFKHDIDVDRARKWLLPPLQKIRQHCMLSKVQKEDLSARGWDAEVVQNDVYMLVYSGFRELGCRTAFWDGNVSEPPMIGKKAE